MPHESFERNADDFHGASNRNFGFTFATFFLVLCLLPLLSKSSPRIWALMLSAIFLLLAFVWPGALTTPNRLWLKLGLLLQAIASPIGLGILFYAVFTPMALLIRVVFRKNLLATHFNRNAQSYWVHRNPPGPAPDSLTDQF